MKKVLLTIMFFCGCGNDVDFGDIANKRFTIPVNSLPKCDKTTPCKCGSVLTESKVLNGQDNLKNCNFNTAVPAITLTGGAKLDCDGQTISVRVNSKGNYNSMRPAIWIQSDSNDSEVRNCTILGFSEAIHIEFEYIYNATSVEERVAQNLAFVNNTIMLGEDICTYGSSCESNGIFIPGTLQTSSRNIVVWGNYFSMLRSPVTDKDSFLHYGSYFRTTGAKNIVIAFNYFDKINYGYAVRLLYGTENVWILGNTFRMPWERYQSPIKWTPSGIGIELYNGTAKEGFPQFSILAWNTFLMSEDQHWPPEPFGNPPATGINHEYVGIRSGWGPSTPPVDARFNWWRRLDGANYSDTDIARLVYGKNYTVFGKQFEQDYREIIFLPRLY